MKWSLGQTYTQLQMQDVMMEIFQPRSFVCCIGNIVGLCCGKPTNWGSAILDSSRVRVSEQ